MNHRSDDRTQHVLDAIDGAVEDWSSPDAMRWSPPEEPPPAQVWAGVWAHDPISTSPYAAAALGEAVGQAYDAAAALYRAEERIALDVRLRCHGPVVMPPSVAFRVRSDVEHAAALAAAMTNVSGALAKIGERVREANVQIAELAREVAASQRRTFFTPDPDESPRERALRLRQTRNTGPTRDPFERGRRP